jgi:hypothetical protein
VANPKANIDVGVVIFDVEDTVHLYKDMTDATRIWTAYQSIINKDEEDNARLIIWYIDTWILVRRLEVVVFEEVRKSGIPYSAGLVETIKRFVEAANMFGSIRVFKANGLAYEYFFL